MPRTRVIKIAPLEYMHVLNLNSNVTTLIIGPRTFTCMDNMNVVLEPHPMVVVPSGHYCIVENPVIRTSKGKAMLDEYGQAQLSHGEREIRFPQAPFALYPGELLAGKVELTKVIPAGQALVLRAARNFVDVVERETGIRPDPSLCPSRAGMAGSVGDVTAGGPEEKEEKREGEEGPKGEKREPRAELEIIRVARRTGDEWIVKGPGHYYPRIEEEVKELRHEKQVNVGESLVMSALADCIDEKYHKQRGAGERWLMSEPGPYLPGPYEHIVRSQKEYILNEETAIHLRAEHDFHDDLFDIERKAGDEWLVTHADTKSYTLGVQEIFVGKRMLTVLDVRSYVTVLHPWDGERQKHRIGEKETRRGPAQFYLQPPFEQIIGQVKKSIVLGPEHRVAVVAEEAFDDFAGCSSKHNREVAIRRNVGDRWKYYGPGEYWPPHQVSYRVQTAMLYNSDFGLALFDYHVVMFVLAILAVLLAIWTGRTLMVAA